MYESYFLRANHPEKPQAFWIRYTLFHSRSPEQTPEAELWIALFDEGKAILGGHERLPMAHSSWSTQQLDVTIGESFLRDGHAVGSTSHEGIALSWNLTWEGVESPITLLSPGLYKGGFPKAKAVVPRPMVQFSGNLTFGEQTWHMEGWPGSQNHNWGTQHTDAYAWGQVMGFEGHPEASLECATARLKLAGLWTPPLSLAILRFDGVEVRFDSLVRAALSSGHFSPGQWEFKVGNGSEVLEGYFTCPEDAWVSLPYRNPSGGMKRCLNSKVAQAIVKLTRKDGTQINLRTAHRAAFEILEDE